MTLKTEKDINKAIQILVEGVHHWLCLLSHAIHFVIPYKNYAKIFVEIWLLDFHPT